MPTPMIDAQGVVHDVPDEHVEARTAIGWRPQSFSDVLAASTDAARQEAYGGIGGGLKALGASALSGATLGLSNVAARALGGDDAAIALEGLREQNPGISFAGELGGAIAPALLTGGASLAAGIGRGVEGLGARAAGFGAERLGAGLARAGAGVAELGAEGGTLSRLGESAIGRAAEYAPSSLVGSLGGRVSEAVGGGLRGALASGASEGALYGAGQGISELALEQDPLTWERAATTIGSNALFGAAAGGALGVGANAVERGLHRAGSAIDEYVASRGAREAVQSDLAGLDRKGLRAAEAAELARVETERVVQRAQVADELAQFREDLKQQKIWLTTKKTTEAGVPVEVPAGEPPSVGAPNDQPAASPPTPEIPPPPPTPPPRPIASQKEFRDLQDAFRTKLTPDEIKQSLRYTREDYNDVNRFLRGDKRMPKIGERGSEIIPAVDSMLDKGASTETLVTHRAAHFDPGEAGASLQPGDVFVDPAYLSTSYRSDNIGRFGNTHFVITSPPGTKIAPVPSAAGEGEFLLARNSPLRITGRSEEGGKITYHATVEPGATPIVAPKFEPIKRAAGGTQGGRWYQDETGQQWFGKGYSGSTERVEGEHLANQLYRMFGVSAPETKIATVDGVRTMMSKEIPGTSTRSVADLNKSDIAGGFVIDAWLGNRDVLGTGLDNVLLSGGKAHRIDNGGSLIWRAMGEPKDFGAEVAELSGMRGKRFRSGEVFGTLSEDDVAKQLRQFSQHYGQNRAAIDQLIDQSGLSNAAKKKIRDGLHSRAEWLMRQVPVAAPVANGDFLPVPEKRYTEQRKEFASKLTPEEDKAVDVYTSSTYKDLNRALRNGEIRNGREGFITKIDDALAKSSLRDNATLYRGLSGEEATQFRGLAVGDSFEERAFTSTSSSPDAFKRDVNLHIAVPAGYQAAPVPSAIEEKEWLLRRNTRFVVTGIEDSGATRTIHVRVAESPPPIPVETMVSAKTGRSPDAPPLVVTKAEPPATTVAPTALAPPQVEGLGPLGKRLLKTDRALDRLLDNPKALAAKPQRALDALQMQEAALEDITAKSDHLRIKFAADTSGDRVAALEAIPAALERNRALQMRIGKLLETPHTPRLADIASAHDVLNMPAAPKSMAEQAFSGTAFGAITGVAHALPLIGQIPGVAHFIGAKGAELATRVVFGKLGEAVGSQSARAGGAIKALLGAAKASAPYVPVLATKTLAALRYGSSKRDKEPETLPELYKARTDEIKQLTAYDATGTPVLRPEVRQQIGAKLRPIAAVDPVMADRIETALAARIEYLSSIIPRRPDIAGIQTGPDKWQPSDMAMRSWARSAAAAEDPYAVLERAVHGAVTPEDARTMQAVHPEILADFTRQVTSQLPTLRETLPYDRQLSLSILTGVPVAAALDPKILKVLQGQFPDEPGSVGGTQAPKAVPQFGSISKSISQPTPAQSRAQGAHV